MLCFKSKRSSNALCAVQTQAKSQIDYQMKIGIYCFYKLDLVCFERKILTKKYFLEQEFTKVKKLTRIFSVR